MKEREGKGQTEGKKGENEGESEIKREIHTEGEKTASAM